MHWADHLLEDHDFIVNLWSVLDFFGTLSLSRFFCMPRPNNNNNNNKKEHNSLEEKNQKLMWMCGKQMWNRDHVRAAFLLPAGVWDWNQSLGRELKQKTWVMCKNWGKERCSLDWWWCRNGMDAFIWASWSRSKGSGRCLTSANDPCALMENPQRWIELFSLNRTLYAWTDTLKKRHLYLETDEVLWPQLIMTTTFMEADLDHNPN